MEDDAAHRVAPRHEIRGQKHDPMHCTFPNKPCKEEAKKDMTRSTKVKRQTTCPQRNSYNAQHSDERQASHPQE